MNIHLQQPVLTMGPSLARCEAAAILLHGRGRSPDEMLALATELDVPGVAYLAPAAAEASWYPYSFLEPLERNQPNLGYALEACQAQILAARAAGVPLTRIVLLGFSQGACLTAEYLVRHPGRYGGAILCTGGLHGPPGSSWQEGEGDFGGTPLVISGAEEDGWVPVERMRESAAVFRRMGATVALQTYPGTTHHIAPAAIEATRSRLRALVAEEN